jgi:MFS family permease
MGMAVGGAFLKPVIPATVRRHAPEERRPMGFSLFYASVNAGSVVGKVLTKIVRARISLRASMINAVVACVLALAVTLAAFREPDKDSVAESPSPDGAPAAPPAKGSNPLEDVLFAFSQVKLLLFLVCISGYYLLIEQFYQTFPVYIVRAFGEDAPREYITLINPASIALLQVFVGRFTKRLPPLPAIAFGVLVAAGSMLLMGAVPTLVGACMSFFVFAVAEMLLSPRYYEYVSSFAPKGREGLYMGLAIAPLGIGGLVGGVLSGRLIARFIPKEGPRDPLAVWGTYAAIGVGCAALLAVYAAFAARKRPPLVASLS